MFFHRKHVSHRDTENTEAILVNASAAKQQLHYLY